MCLGFLNLALTMESEGSGNETGTKEENQPTNELQPNCSNAHWDTKNVLRKNTMSKDLANPQFHIWGFLTKEES